MQNNTIDLILEALRTRRIPDEAKPSLDLPKQYRPKEEPMDRVAREYWEDLILRNGYDPTRKER